MKGIQLLLFFALLLIDFKLSSQNPTIQHFTTYDGLPSNNVLYIFQDSKKFLWFGTAAGAVRYDGTTFKTLSMTDGLLNSSVSIIDEDSFGRIWLLNATGKINYLLQDKIYNSKNSPFLDSIPIGYLYFQDKDKTMYFYHYGYKGVIYALDSANRISKFQIPYPVMKSIASLRKEMLVWQVKRSSDNEILLWTNLGILKTRSLKETPSQVNDKYTDWNLFPWWYSTWYTSGYNPKTKTYRIFNIPYETPLDSMELNLNSQAGINCIFEDKNGVLWIATDDNGVSCIRNKQVIAHIKIKHARKIIQDHEGNIWIASEKGAYKISPYFLSGKHFSINNFQNEEIERLTSGPGEGIWCVRGTNIDLLRNGEFYKLNYKPGNSISRIRGLTDNSLIIITQEDDSNLIFLTGITIDTATKKVAFRNINRGPFAGNFVLSENEKEIFAVDGDNLLSLEIIGNKIKKIRQDSIEPGTGQIFFDANKNLIIGTPIKSYIIKNNKKQPYQELSFIYGKWISDHIILDKNTDLYSIEDGSIYMVNNKKIFNLASAFGYPVDPLRKALTYAEPTLHLWTRTNIYLCDNPLNILKNKPVELRMIEINFKNIRDVLVKNDSLYIASDDGLTVIPEATIRKKSTQSPIPYFKSVQVNDKEVDLSKPEVTLTGNNKIRFTFAGISYSSSPVFFSYKLEGFDTSWTTGTTREIVYSNLPRGKYVFMVRAGKPASPWSIPIEYRVTIKAHYWQHPLFFIFLSLLFTGLIALIIIRRKNIQIKRRELDNQLISLEQKALQSMMNPHFIFNSLGSIQTYLLQNKSGEAGLYLSQFARLIRQNLNAINASSINLEEEIDRLKNYLDLEKLRMEDKFEYHIEVAANVETDELQIPSMIIQPFVENAIWHGIAFLKVKGKIIIKFSLQDDKSLVVIVEDNGIGMKRSETFSANKEKRAHLGMELARKRLEILGRKFSVKTCLKYSELFPGDLNPGTRVELVVPIGS